MALRDNLKQLREQQGMTGKEFAAAVGISYTTYMNYENTKLKKGSWPNEETLIKIATALHVSLDDLLGYHLDEYDKAAALFTAATGKKAILRHDSVTIRTSTGKVSRWLFPISKTGFIKAIEESAADFDKNIRPKLLKDSINNNIDIVYQKENLKDKDIPLDRENLLKAIASIYREPVEHLTPSARNLRKTFSESQLLNAFSDYLPDHNNDVSENTSRNKQKKNVAQKIAQKFIEDDLRHIKLSNIQTTGQKNAATPEGDDDKTSDPTKEN